ncbi:hypothetical protein PHMEG_00016313 [Phytophthora megakarya]|uniref:Uncharacterized protein n=1 Tax=Phytophthora megakarya TaxID=4795 RepID=A0A225W186_9STRA|nr:hypothetical protein PHMEG_00016313 [Phytophthora megakarya]
MTASYIEAARKQKAGEATAEGSEKKKNRKETRARQGQETMTKAQQAPINKEEKKSRENRTIEGARAHVARLTAKRKAERERILEQEYGGAEARL